MLLEREIEESDKNNCEGNSLFKKQLAEKNSKFLLNSNFILNDSEIKKISPFIKIEIRKNMSKSLKPSSLKDEKFDSIISVNEENFTASSRKNLLEKIYSLKKEIEENYKGNILFWHRVKEAKEKILFEESENSESDNSETEFDQDSLKIYLEDPQKVVSNDSFKSLESYDNDFESFNNENDSILSGSSYFKKLSKEEDNPFINEEGKNLNLKMIEYFPQHQESSLDESKIEIINFENSNDENDNKNQENMGLEMENNSSITSSKDKSYYSRNNSPSYSPENDQTLDFEKNINSNEKSEEKIQHNFKKNNLENLSSISDNESNDSFTKSFKNIFNSENDNLKEINQEKEDSIKQISSSNNSSKDKSYSSKNNSQSYSLENNETLDFEKSKYENENLEEKIKNSFKENNLVHLSSISDNESNESFTRSFKNLFNSENDNLKKIHQEKKDYVKENTLPSGSSCKKSSERSASSDSSEKSISFEISEDISSLDSLKYSSLSGSSEKAELKNFDPINLHETDRKETQRLKKSLTSKNLISSKDQEELLPLTKLKNSSKSLYKNHSDINSNSIKVTKSKNNSLNSNKSKHSKESDLSSINDISIETKNKSKEDLLPSKNSENLDLSGDKEIHNNNLIGINNNLSPVNEPISKANTSSNNKEKLVFVQKNDEDTPAPAEKTKKEERKRFVKDETPKKTGELNNTEEQTFESPKFNTPDKIDALNDSGKRAFIEPGYLLGQDDQLNYSGKQTFVQEESDTPGQNKKIDNNKKQYFVLKEFNKPGSAEKSENQGKINFAQPKFDTPEQTNQLTNTTKQTFVQPEFDTPEETQDSKNFREETSAEPEISSKIAQKLKNFGEQGNSQSSIAPKLTKQPESQGKQTSFQPVVESKITQQPKNLGEQGNTQPDAESKLTKQLENQEKQTSIKPVVKSLLAQDIKNFGEIRNLKSDVESKLTKEKENQGKLTFIQPEEKLISESNKLRINAENILRNREIKSQNNWHTIEIPKPNIQRNKIQNPEQPKNNAEPESNQSDIINSRNLEQNSNMNNERISSSPIKGNNSVPLNLNKNQSSSVPKKTSRKKENPKKVLVKSRVRSSSGNQDNDPNKGGSSDSLKDSKKKKKNEPQRNKEITKPNKRVTFNFDNPVIIESPNSRKDTDKRSNLSKGSDKKQEIIAQPEEDLREGSNNEENSDGIVGNLPKTDVENKWKWWHTVVAVLGGSVLLLVGYYYFVGKNKGVLR